MKRSCRSVTELKRRRQLLVEAFVYKGALDQPTYQEEFDKLNEEITLAEMEAKMLGWTN